MDSKGVVSLHVPEALAKRDWIIELRQNIHLRSDKSCVIVYIGDSLTDMSALLKADIGIVIENSSSTKMIAAMWCIQIVPLRHRDQHGFGSILDGDLVNWGKKLLWQAESWKEIDDALIQLDEKWL